MKSIIRKNNNKYNNQKLLKFYFYKEKIYVYNLIYAKNNVIYMKFT